MDEILKKIELLRRETVAIKNNDELLQLLIEGLEEWDEVIIEYGKQELLKRIKN